MRVSKTYVAKQESRFILGYQHSKRTFACTQGQRHGELYTDTDVIDQAAKWSAWGRQAEDLVKDTRNTLGPPLQSSITSKQQETSH